MQASTPNTDRADHDDTAQAPAAEAPPQQQQQPQQHHQHQHQHQHQHVDAGGTAPHGHVDAVARVSSARPSASSSDQLRESAASTDDLRRAEAAAAARPRGNYGPMTNPQQPGSSAAAGNRTRFMRSSFGRVLGGMKSRSDRGPQSLQPSFASSQTTPLARQ
jgi:hypothetical protein